jgi:hypothetical protein
MKRNIPFISISVIRCGPAAAAAAAAVVFSRGLTKKEDRLEPFALFTHVSSFHVAGHDVPYKYSRTSGIGYSSSRTTQRFVIDRWYVTAKPFYPSKYPIHGIVSLHEIGTRAGTKRRNGPKILPCTRQ